MTIDDVHRALLRSVHPMTFAQMVALSSEQGVARAIALGTIVRVLPNHYASQVHAGSWAARARAALVWGGPEVMLGGTSALHAWGAVDAPDGVSIVAPWEMRLRGPGWLRVRRFTTMPERFEIAGMPVVGPEVAVVLAHGQLPAGRRASAVHDALAADITAPDRVLEVLASMARVPSRRELVRRLIASAEGAESYLEERSRVTVLRGSDFAGIVRQHRVRVDGQGARIDAFDPATLTAFEFDSKQHHGSEAQRRADIARDALLASIGIQTVRFDYWDVMERPQWCRDIALATLRQRRGTVSEG